MTIATSASKTIGRGNGATTAFTYAFLIPSTTALRVTHVSAAGIETVLSSSQYSVSGIGDRAGGTVTYPLSGSPMAVGQAIVIERALPLQQLTTLRNQGGYYPASVEDALDYLMMAIQQVAGGGQNYPLALTFPAVDVNPDTELPPAGQRAGMFMSFDANGNPLMLPATGMPGDLSPYSVLATASTTARALAGRFTTFIDVKDFGAACDDSTDDTAAIQAAIDSVGDTTVTRRSGIVVMITGPCRITSTITIRRKSIVLMGLGWGDRGDSGTRRSWLRWAGAAGSPMLKVQDVAGFGIRNLRLIGRSAAPPTAAINFNETNDGVPITSCFLENVFIGPYAGETDDALQFTNGILLDGLGANNSEHIWTNVKVHKVAQDGVHVGSTQNVNINIRGFFGSNCGRSALYNCGQVTGSAWSFANNAVDIYVPLADDNAATVNGETSVHGYFSEVAGRMLEALGSCRVTLSGTSFNISASLNADGKLVKAEGNIAVSLTLRDFRFLQASAPPASPYLSMSPSAAGHRHIILDNISGWASLTGGNSGMDVVTTNAQARAYVFFRENPQSTGLAFPRLAQNFLCGVSGQQWDITHFDAPSNTQMRLWDDFVGDVLADQWGSAVGSDPQVVAPAVLAGGAHVMRMTTGDDAAATMAVNGVQLQSALNWTANLGPVVFEVRVLASAITAVAIFVGFTDQVAALEMPFTLGAGDVLTSNASDAVGFLFDTAADTDNWWLVGVATDVDATKQNAGTAPVAATYERLRVELAGAVATFYRNGVKVGTAMNGAVSGAALTPVIAAFSRGAASRSIDGDYILVESERPYP